MKLYQIKHVNEKHNENSIMGADLRFTKSICSETGETGTVLRQPDQWDNVERITHLLFLAWDDFNKLEGVVYVGEFKGA